jgi:hypothetical protein
VGTTGRRKSESKNQEQVERHSKDWVEKFKFLVSKRNDVQGITVRSIRVDTAVAGHKNKTIKKKERTKGAY